MRAPANLTSACRTVCAGPHLPAQFLPSQLPNARAPFGDSVVYQQPTAQAALQLIDSLLSAHTQYPTLLAAAVYSAHWLMANHSDALERAAAAELVRRGWRCLSALDGNGLAKLLLAAAAMESLTGKQLRAWQAAYQAWLARDGARLPRDSRLSILEAAARLSRTSGLRLPGRMLGGHLGYLCRPPVLAHLRLPQLAALCLHARELGFRLTAEQHAALAAAAGQKASQEFSGSAVTSLLRCWADMEAEHRTWVAEGGRKQQLVKSSMQPPSTGDPPHLLRRVWSQRLQSGSPSQVTVCTCSVPCNEDLDWPGGVYRLDTRTPVASYCPALTVACCAPRRLPWRGGDAGAGGCHARALWRAGVLGAGPDLRRTRPAILRAFARAAGRHNSR